MTEQQRRTEVRQRYDARCGYCSVREAEAGSELEIDHFKPRTAGGGDDADNLVYCCPTCNRLKGDYWPGTDSLTITRRLLHPARDDLGLHLREDADGRVIALTDTGAFHVSRLRLNRPPLLALRQARRDVVLLRESLEAAQAQQARLRERIATLELNVQNVLTQLARLLEP